MFNYKEYKVFLACGHTDIRKSINGLSEIVWPDIYNEEITMNISLEDFYNLIKSPGIKQKIKRS